MTDADDAWRAVLANPWADAPRVAWAATLTDPARAAFVATQLDVAARRRRREYVMSWEALLARPWLPPWCNDATGLRGTWGRGCVEGVGGRASTVLAHVDEIAASTPLLDLSLSGLDAPLSTVLRHPQLQRLRSLDLGGVALTVDDIKVLVESPRSWVCLSLYHCDLDDDALDLLAQTPHLSQTRWINLGGNRFADPNYIVDEMDGATYGNIPTPATAALRARHGDVHWLGHVAIGESVLPEALHDGTTPSWVPPLPSLSTT